MRDFILLMHNDTVSAIDPESWPRYFAVLRAHDAFEGGSAIGGGETFRREGTPGAVSTALGGYIRVRATDLTAAQALLAGNPVYEAGGTVEIRHLPRE